MIEKLFGNKYKRMIASWIRYSGSKITVDGFANYSFAVSLAVGFVAGMMAISAFIPLMILGFVFTFIVLHGLLLLSVERRTHFVENVLPDALQLMAANSRAGYIPSRALLLSARKEFGPLSEAIKNVGKELATGEDLEGSLNKMTKYIKSDLLDRTVKLINEGIRLGGQFAVLLEENATDIRRVQAIKNEMKANVMMYTIFIAFAGVVGAPLLYALSGFLIGTIGRLGSSIHIPDSSSVKMPMMKMGSISVGPDFLLVFSLVAIAVTAISGSLIVGLIDSGKEKNGLKYMPIFLLAGIAIYLIARVVIGGMFGIIVPG